MIECKNLSLKRHYVWLFLVLTGEDQYIQKVFESANRFEVIIKSNLGQFLFGFRYLMDSMV